MCIVFVDSVILSLRDFPVHNIPIPSYPPHSTVIKDKRVESSTSRKHSKERGSLKADLKKYKYFYGDYIVSAVILVRPFIHRL